MNESKHIRRAAAGRSGGVFQVLTEADGTPTYRYESKNGEIRSPISSELDLSIGRNDNPKREDVADTISERENPEETDSQKIDPEIEGETQTQPRLTLIYQTTAKQLDDGATTSQQDVVIKDQRWAKPRRVLADKFAKGKNRIKDTFTRLKTKSHRKQSNESVYTVDLHGDGDKGYNHNERHSSEEHTPGIKNDYTEPQFEDSYFINYEEAFNTSADLEFFCSFPELGSDGGSNAATMDSTTCLEDDVKHVDNRKSTVSRDTRNHYEVLGLGPGCESKEINSRARYLMSKLHLDRLSIRTSKQKLVDAQEFARVSLAKTELLDTELRASHDY